MTTACLIPLLPLMIVAGVSVAAMLGIAVRRQHETTVAITVTGLVAGVLALIPVFNTSVREATPLLVFDDFALFYLGLVSLGSLFVAFMAYGYFTKRGDRPDEFYILLLTAALGSGVLVAARHFVSLFLGLEILSVSLYAMVAYTRGERDSIEAGVKYLVLAAGSAAFLLFGMALVYAETGTMGFSRVAVAALIAADEGANATLLLGFALLIVGIGFKLAVVPFHMWTPDVYQGAPSPATAFVATVSKGAIFATLMRFFGVVDVHSRPTLMWVFIVLSVGSMTVGNLLALMQANVKRILAYSSIANLGYLLVAFLASGSLASTAAAFYLTAYFATVLGAFSVVIYMSGVSREADRVEDYRGLFWRKPWVAAAFTAMMLSLAGIPLTAGFISKFYVLAAGGQSAQWWLLLALVLNSTLGLYYYLRVILAMSAPIGDEEPVQAGSRSAGTVFAILTVVVAVLGVYPGPALRLIENLVSLMLVTG